MKRSFMNGARMLFAAVILLLVFYFVDWQEVVRVIWAADLIYLGLLLLLSVPLIGVSVIKWWLFLRFFGVCPSLWHLAKLYLVGYFANLFLPSQFGGDVIRSFELGKQIGQRDAAVATFLERYTGVVAMVALGIPGILMLPSVTPPVRYFYLCIVLVVILSLFVLFSPYCWRLFNSLPLPASSQKKVSRIGDALQLVRREHRVMIEALLLSVLFHTLTVVNTACAAYAVGWNNAPVWAFFVVLPCVLLIAALPLTPQGLGIQEGAFYLFLTTFGAQPEQAVAIAVLLRLKAYLLGACGGVLFMRVGRKVESLPTTKKYRGNYVPE
jgi:glycosyltransferase 2 family protein